MSPRLLEVDDLHVQFASPEGPVEVVRGLSFQVAAGETLGLVGESGCGKTVTALALLRLLGPGGRLAGGSIRYGGRDVARFSAPELRSFRGKDVGFVFQDPMVSLNPVFPVERQLGEAVAAAGASTRAGRRARCLDLLREVGISEPEVRLAAYPFELSGGLRQRVMIAMAVASNPGLVIADEPTTALDVTVQAQIMELLARLRRERSMALLLVTHDLGLVAQHVDRVVVMYAGLAVEEASTAQLFAHPLHPYTRGLLASVPGESGARLTPIPGTVPHPSRLPSGCAFRDRCGLADDECARACPPLEQKKAGHRARCRKV